MLDPAYRLWQVGEDRFALIPASQVTPVLGFVSRNVDELWIIERSGEILKVSYASSEDAAAALVALERKERKNRSNRS